MLGGLLSLAVVAAAGVGGWFGYERAVAEIRGDEPAELDDGTGIDATAVGSSSSGVAAPAPAPWPDDVVMPTRTWTSFRTMYHPAGDVVRQQVDFDPLTRQAQMTLFDPEGIEVGWFEVYGRDADFVAGASYGFAVPPTLPDLLPEPTWAHTTLRSDTTLAEGQGVRRLAFTVDVPGFSLASPIPASEWRERIGRGFGFDVANLTIDLDAEGHVVRIDPDGTGTGVVALFAELTEPVVFESPLGN